jgi:hypothetical protein
MPLLPAAPRAHKHTRTITIDGYEREDGLWDIEGHLTDVKAYGFQNRYRGWIEPGTPLHEMRVRLTIGEDMVIREAEAVTLNGPFRACPDATPLFSGLAGIKIGPGWMRAVRTIFGGVHGCTHITEMLPQMATAAFQTLVAKRSNRADDKEMNAEPPPKKRPAYLDTCHAMRSDGEAVKIAWPEFYTGPASADPKPTD